MITDPDTILKTQKFNITSIFRQGVIYEYVNIIADPDLDP